MAGKKNQNQSEAERVRTAYGKRQRENVSERYSQFLLCNLLFTQERDLALMDLLRSAGVHTFAGSRILDVGCGGGGLLRHLLEFEAEPRRMFGIDLLIERIHEAHDLSPNFQFLCGSASQLPFPNATFDFVFQFTMFTSILRKEIKQAAANEILRVLRPKGIFIWYDFSYDNPRNPDVRGIGRREMFRLFQGCRIRCRRITLAPPLARLVARGSAFLYRLLSAPKVLCTHYLCLIEKS